MLARAELARQPVAKFAYGVFTHGESIGGVVESGRGQIGRLEGLRDGELEEWPRTLQHDVSPPTA